MNHFLCRRDDDPKCSANPEIDYYCTLWPCRVPPIALLISENDYPASELDDQIGSMLTISSAQLKHRSQ